MSFTTAGSCTSTPVNIPWPSLVRTLKSLSATRATSVCSAFLGARAGAYARSSAVPRFDGLAIMKTGWRPEAATISLWADRFVGSDVATTIEPSVELRGRMPYLRATASGISLTACGSYVLASATPMRKCSATRWVNRSSESRQASATFGQAVRTCPISGRRGSSISRPA
ncbi:MAG: hypothetical protein AMS19_14255 [Gemmatimonas sp. SG8_23]|nr:MAG: hypothetical protein AMS19_14255 [Gemmatimonas sp. SG8_23]